MNRSGLFAQAVDNTGRDVTLIIIGLLMVAALLAGLTAWYWRYTDPRKRLQVGSTDGPLDVERDEHEGAGTAPGATAAPGAAAMRRSERAATSDGELLEGDDGADEWLRLTGPRDRAIR